MMSPSFAPGQHQRRHHQRVRRDGELHALDRRVEIRDDLRDRHVHDAAVEHHHELRRREYRDRQPQPRAPSSTVACPPHSIHRSTILREAGPAGRFMPEGAGFATVCARPDGAIRRPSRLGWPRDGRGRACSRGLQRSVGQHARPSPCSTVRRSGPRAPAATRSPSGASMTTRRGTGAGWVSARRASRCCRPSRAESGGSARRRTPSAAPS